MLNLQGFVDQWMCSAIAISFFSRKQQCCELLKYAHTQRYTEKYEQENKESKICHDEFPLCNGLLAFLESQHGTIISSCRPSLSQTEGRLGFLVL